MALEYRIREKEIILNCIKLSRRNGQSKGIPKRRTEGERKVKKTEKGRKGEKARGEENHQKVVAKNEEEKRLHEAEKMGIPRSRGQDYDATTEHVDLHPIFTYYLKATLND